MVYSLDVNGEYKSVKSKLLRLSLLFSLILTIVIIGDVLLIALSKDNYIVQYIIASIITVLFAWFAIYFFFNIFNKVNNRYRYFKGYQNGLTQTDEVEFIKQGSDMVYINGVYAYPLFLRFTSGLEQKDKIIYTLEENLHYEMGDKLTITTYQRILIQAERHV